jgi:NitT/TauT family transport system ATP-binding protein
MSVVLRLERVGHAYLGRTVLDGIDLALRAGEIAALVGPSGCGKSTLAHIAAGVVEPLRGRVTRSCVRHGMVFQDPRLMPWATARDNIAYPLKLAGIPRRARATRVLAAADRVALAREDLDKFPVELSGGMRQRTSIARALVMEPDFVFFDEPFTALDQALKRRMQDLVVAAARDGRFGALFITHDLMEAVRIADRILVLDPHGRGLAGERPVAGVPGARDDRTIFDTVQGFLKDDPLFRHIHDVDERRVA